MSGQMLVLFADVGWEVWGVAVLAPVVVGLFAFLGWKYWGKTQGRKKSVFLETAKEDWAGKERRTSPRESPRTGEVLILVPDGSDQPQSGTILDRSLGGVGLEIGEEVEVGKRLQLRLREWDQKAPWVLAEVRYCRRKGDSWRAGCQFVEISALEVMNIFGPPDPD